MTLPEYAAGPLAALDNLVLPAPRITKRSGKKNRFRQIEKRFGIQQPKKKAIRRSMDQLMLDLVPKWQRPALKDRQKEQHLHQHNMNDDRRERSGKGRSTGSRAKKKDKRRARKPPVKKQAGKENADMNVKMKFGNVKPAWRQIAAFEADDGSTKSAISSLLHSGVRLSMHQVERNRENPIGSRTNINIVSGLETRSRHGSDSGSGQERVKQSSCNGYGSSSGTPSWKPRFLVQASAEPMSRKAADLLLELKEKEEQEEDDDNISDRSR
eukprot:g1501.t1